MKGRDSSLSRTSRYISLILRHKPEIAGLVLDAHGWADVKELIEGVSKTHHLTQELLEEIVRTDEKQRYSFKKYRASIANEGLKAMNRLFVHLSGDRETARKVGARHGRPVLFRVRAGQMHRDGIRFFRSVNGVWLAERVPAVYLEQGQDSPDLR